MLLQFLFRFQDLLWPSFMRLNFQITSFELQLISHSHKQNYKTAKLFEK